MIAIGSDHMGYKLKEIIKKYLQEELRLQVKDFGSYSVDPVDYPDIAVQVGESVARGEHDLGILICGTGIGMSIAANKVPSIRAALCHDVYSAERARKSNNAQILTMGARVIGQEHAKKIVEAFLKSEFSGGPSTMKVNKIMLIEDKYLKRMCLESQ
jgi:ribose 5-phosphate isomerase B